MIAISKNGLNGASRSIKGIASPDQTVITAFNKNPPSLMCGELNMSCVSLEFSGSSVGKRAINIGASTYNISPFTVWGTNGNTVLTFQDPNSLIASLTFPRSNITAEYNKEAVQIGSIWGTFNGVPSDTEQTIFFVGYPLVEIVINPEALKGLLSK